MKTIEAAQTDRFAQRQSARWLNTAWAHRLLVVPSGVVALALLSIYVDLLQQSVTRGESLRNEQRVSAQSRVGSTTRLPSAPSIGRQLEHDTLALAVMAGR